MKLLVICQYYYPEPFRITDICESLVGKGHDVTVLTGLPNYPEGIVVKEYRKGKKRAELINGVKVIRNFEIGRGSGKYRLFMNYLSFTLSASFKTLLFKEKFDRILVYQLSPVTMSIPAIIYKKKYQTKILLYCLDLWPASLSAGGIRENSIVYKPFLKMSKWIYNSVDAIAVTSCMFKDYFKTTFEMDIDQIDYLPQYAEDVYLEVEENREHNRFHLVFAGNIGDMQSVETIIKAAHLLREYQEIIFHIIGDGSRLEECQLLSQALTLHNVIFYGRRPITEMPKFYSMADAMLITLKNNQVISYTLPGKVQSYMAARKPIIGAINGETSRVIKEANCGFCCPAEDEKELANMILKFCQSHEKEWMGENSYAYYTKHFRKENFLSSLESSIFKLGG